MDSAIITFLESAGFTAHKRLGKGSFGSVFQCINAEGKDVAVKVVIGDSECEISALEAEIMKSIRPHPNVLPLISFEEYAECSLMALPLASGGDTLKLMQDRALVPLPHDDARGLFLQLVDAVNHLHKHGIVHRDIKCENVLLTGPKRRTVLLADFGFAARYCESTLLTEPWGSLHYSSPEIVSRVPYKGPEVDVWSLGVVLYAWCTGRLPFSGASEAEIAARINAGSFNMPPSLTGDLADLVSSMLTPDPIKRISVAGIQKHPWLAPSDAGGIVGIVSRSTSDPTIILNIQRQKALVEIEARQPTQPVRRNSVAEVAPPSRLAKVGARIARVFRKEK